MAVCQIALKISALFAQFFPCLLTLRVVLQYVYSHWSDTFRVLVIFCGQKVDFQIWQFAKSH